MWSGLTVALLLGLELVDNQVPPAPCSAGRWVGPPPGWGPTAHAACGKPGDEVGRGGGFPAPTSGSPVENRVRLGPSLAPGPLPPRPSSGTEEAAAGIRPVPHVGSPC